MPQTPRRQDRFYRKPIRKSKYFQNYNAPKYDEEEHEELNHDDDDVDNRYVTEVRKLKKGKKRLIYIDEIDGDDEQSEPEQEADITEEERVRKPPLKKNKKKPKKSKAGIMKSIKM